MALYVHEDDLNTILSTKHIKKHVAVNLNDSNVANVAKNLAFFGYYKIVDNRPDTAWNQTATPEYPIVDVDGVYTRNWTVTDWDQADADALVARTRKEARDRVDAKADVYLTTVGSKGEYRGVEYTDKYQEALTYVLNDSKYEDEVLVDEDNPLLGTLGEAALLAELPNIYFHRGGPDGATGAEVAATYIARSAPWRQFAAFTNSIRIKGKATFDEGQADTPQEILDAEAAIDWSAVESAIP